MIADNIVKIIKLGIITMLTMLSFNILAKNSPHTWHTVSAHNGSWYGRLQMINQGGLFVGRDNAQLVTFTISPNKTQDFGFIFDQNANFDVAYTLTLTQEKSKNLMMFASKACVFVITASGPAKPDIRVSSFNGAQCAWKIIDGIGEDFFVS